MNVGHDLSRIIKFATGDAWAEALHDALTDHVGAAMEEFDLEFDEIGDLISDHYTGVLLGTALEDLMTRRFEPDGDNLVDDYLKRRGWNEKAPTKAYLRALRDSAMSLYEVSDVVPGEGFAARDLVRGGDPIRIREKTGSRTLRQWDRIAVRVVPERSAHVLSGVILPFTPEAAEALLEALRAASGKRRKSAKIDIDDDLLANIAHLFTTAWLFDVLPKAMGLQSPIVQNTDGDDLVFHNVRFPLKRGTSAEAVGALLDAQPELHRANDQLWNWLKPSADTIPRAKGPGKLAFGTSTDDGRTVFGTIEIKGKSLVLSVNSANRAKVGTAALSKLLGTAVGKPLTEIVTIEQAMRDHQGRPSAEPAVPPEAAAQLVHDVMDRHYRETLDQPVGMLGDLTPREAAKTASGRKKIAEWLKFIENRAANHPDAADPMATYDFSWIWRELGVEKLRK
ncbi:hypothetical protein [Erythrobacter colymbi]|uniref:hypothetical protein n=1 Tax=Erythrobacter colymbi TaxID=1161202 RepID=UPI000A3927FD|nr:hypothetical protein [Erythrobacter colymbi]